MSNWLLTIHQLPMTEIIFVNWLRSIIYLASVSKNLFACPSNKLLLVSVKIIKQSACKKRKDSFHSGVRKKSSEKIDFESIWKTDCDSNYRRL